ncbi:MAG: DUF805 domain-containing protein [Moraxellaceae bacterium]|nr:DUF805 domain-containing protein [Moraxellaceae bacterium]
MNQDNQADELGKYPESVQVLGLTASLAVKLTKRLRAYRAMRQLSTNVWAKSLIARRGHVENRTPDTLFPTLTWRLDHAGSSATSVLDKLRSIPDQKAWLGMPDTQYRIIFRGELLDGFNRDEVSQTAAQRLGLKPAQLETIFSGQAVVLRKGLDKANAARYLSELRKIGMRAKVQEMTVVARPTTAPDPGIRAIEPAPGFDPEKTDIYTPARPLAAMLDEAADALPAIPAVPTPAPKPVTRPQTEKIMCQKCGDRQTRRKLCRSCGFDMEAYETAQRQLEKEEMAAATRMRLPDISILDSQVPVAMTISPGDEDLLDEAIEKRFGAGRIGRGHLFANTLLVLSAAALVLLAGASLGEFGAIIGLLAAAGGGIYILAPLLVRRLHDIGRNGYAALLGLVPYVNLAFMAYLLFKDGSPRHNRYGAPPAAPSSTLLTAGLVAVIVTVAALYTLPSEAMQRHMGNAISMVTDLVY